MKTTLSILSCLLAVLIQQGQALNYGTCNAPTCPRDTFFDSNNCLCNTNRDAVCPDGYGPIVKGHGLCACEKLMIPFCKAGFELNTNTCSCNFRQPPTCPHGASLTPHSALCIGTADVMCPPGAELKEGCMCFSARLRQCPEGRLSANGCTCEAVDTEPPTCGKGCELAYDGECRCESTAIECFSHNGYCEDYSYHVGTVEDCCYNPLQERSYKNSNGDCIQ
ncbi:hypothetical protein GBAR_LOCUS30556 [Geodia barretti]|uniref:Uncharacterized protein n=1 Tax=Geodia barretti TaxID=519541 RepID=A0AA35TZV9_GEOBA|nr:hypothetical protein GBAR_LOCUS30556 [Geodia barretti]